MRILHIITRLILGGAQQNTVLSCAAQVAAGHEVHLALGPTYGPEGSLLDEARQSGAVLHEIPSMVRQVSPGKDWACYRALKKRIAQVQPDVVHTHSSKAGILGRAAAWKQRGTNKRPAIIHTVHGLPFHDHQSMFIHKLYVGLERWAAVRCDHLIAITPQMIDCFVENRIAPREKCTVVPSGVDLSRFEQVAPSQRAAVRGEYGLPIDAVVVGLLGRLDSLKGQRDLIDIYPALAKHLQNRSVRLLFIGDGFDRANVEQAIAAAGLNDKVVITGLVEHIAVAGLLSAVDVSVLPSYQEGQSRTLVESLVCGVPVVGYDVGGIPSIIEEGVTGRLVPVGDKAALTAAIAAIIDDPKAAERMTQAGAAHVRAKFDAATMTQAIQRVYDQALSTM